MEYISLQDLKFIIRRNIRKIFVVAIAFAVIAGVYETCNLLKENKSASHTGNVDYNSEMKTYNEQKADMAEIVDDLQVSYTSYARMLKENPVMSIDPYNCSYERIVCVFRGSEKKKSEVISTWLQRKSAKELFGKQSKLWQKYADSIIHVLSNDSDSVVLDIYKVDGIDLKFTATQVRQTIRREAEKSGINYMSIQTAEKKDSYNPELYDFQLGNRDRLTRLSAQLKSVQESSRTLEAPSKGSSVISKPDMAVAVLKYIFFGLVGGILIGILFVLYRVLNQGYIFSREQFGDLLGMDCLASIDGNNFEQVAAEIYESIGLHLEKNAEVLIISSKNCALESGLMEKLKKMNTYRYSFCKGFDQSDSIRKLADADGVILCVLRGNSLETELKDAVSRIRHADKVLLGYVYIDNTEIAV